MFTLNKPLIDDIKLSELSEELSDVLSDTLPEEFGGTIKLDLAFDSIINFREMMSDSRLSIYEQVDIGLDMLLLEYDHSDLDMKNRERLLYEILDKVFGKPPEGEGTDYGETLDITGQPLTSKRETPLIDDEDYDEMEDDEADEQAPDNKRVYSIKQDAKYIYSSFMQDYGIDLFEEQGKLHWFKFLALLEGLSEDTKFRKVIEIRTMKLPSGKGKGVAEQRRAIKKAQMTYALKPE